MLLRAVLFDLDGTLIDSIPLIVASMRHAFEGHPNAPSEPEPGAPPEREQPEPGQHGPAQRSGRLWVPGQ